MAKRIARSTGRASNRVAPGAAAAAKLLSEAEVRDGIRLDSEDVRVLRLCCTDDPPRNAVAIVSAIKLRLEYSQPKPKQEIGVEARVAYSLIDPFAKSAKGGDE